MFENEKKKNKTKQNKTIRLIFWYLLVSENIAISCYHEHDESLTAPICLYVHVPLRSLKSEQNKTIHVFCADMFRRYSQLPAKPFDQINYDHTTHITKIRKQFGDYSCDKLLPEATSRT